MQFYSFIFRFYCIAERRIIDNTAFLAHTVLQVAVPMVNKTDNLFNFMISSNDLIF